ncbi:GFA family protein [Ruegeria discodermiae]|uniref:GFA family protein n=1 Tax=Ruegeria discodermiae TaxID=3064389 RepID=UPI00353234A3
MALSRASCQCGALTLEASADADICIACNCSACQKRTGSAFATVAYIPKSAVSINGEQMSWSRKAESGRDVENYFCPHCGTTVYWTLDFRPEHVGVLIGAFDSPRPDPSRVVWAKEKRPWVSFPAEFESFPEGSPTPRQ